ncbi:hypothetical protein TSTA_061890 [Talaromyces stipitatus ATCC 10500]|uniref:Uncharacterized protein n=1 Tax=Talaromyces stipitatus (strain ATCC 10500 / CBS 375.48 / QM 6759 / NRRL 1006) TaxID=441959 RepID=B8LX51_TALSN|nr:uncharacterized protein TSTA_061890 [Talaromyces stipitatus ATCC 10500]EED22701.1 hypothetical protein TSTA_061890 [Talaromyces stipitatus ATCC 10500]
MDTEILHIRERAPAFHKGGISDSEYLQVASTSLSIVDFLIASKDTLPAGIKQALQKAFSQGSKTGKTGTARNREQALARVKEVRKDDITVPEFLSDALPCYAREGSIFWSGGEKTSTAQSKHTILGDIYFADRRKAIASSIRRAFHSIALRYVIQQILEIRGIQHFTTEVKKWCVDTILSEGIDTESKEISKWFSTEYEMGAVYESYTQKLGYGIIFYLFALPASTYEKYLNRTDDVSFVVHHYLSQGFEVEESSNAAATSIMGYVKDRFCRQMSIFRKETLNLSRPQMPNKGKRKRGYSSPSRPANTAPQTVTSQQPNDEAHASQQEPNSWATFTCQQVELSTDKTPIQQPGLSTPLPLSPRNPPITHRPGTHVSHSPLHSHIATAYEITGASNSVLTGNQPHAENGGVHFTKVAAKDLGCFHHQNFPSMNTISTNSQRHEQPPPALGASQSQQNPGFGNLYLTEPEPPYSLPSFNSISAIPTGSPVSNEPSNIVSILLPSFSQITGIPSP